jgi:hypothetical protein
MSDAAQGQAALAAALLDPAAPGPPDPRFAVHRNNVLAGLIGALGDGFPAVRALVGEAFFRAMAGAFARAHPPRSPVMLLWGDAFPGWIEGFAPAAAVPYLADVARIEHAWTAAYHAADAPVLTAADLRAAARGDGFGALRLRGAARDDLGALRLRAAARGDGLGAMRLRAHPSVHLSPSVHPALSLWADVTARPGAPVDLARAETALIARPGADVIAQALTPEGAAFVRLLLRGATMGAIAEAAGQGAFDLSAELGRALALGLVTALDPIGPLP